MLQFYFMSIALNAIAGFLLISNDEGDKLEFDTRFSFKDESFRFVVGILCLITGFMKILSPVEGSTIIIGDLIPAVVGIVSGFILIFEYYRNRSTLVSPEHSEKIDRHLVGNKRLIGFAAIIAAALHFLFPKALLL